jgi:hypothetical protein
MYKIATNVEPPEDKHSSDKYKDIYESLEKLPVDSWMSIEIPHLEDNRLDKIHQVRRAVQRWFSQTHNKSWLKAVTQVESVSPVLSRMYIQKLHLQG